MRATAGKCAEAFVASHDKQVAILQPGQRVHLEIGQPAYGKLLGRPFFEGRHREPSAACQTRERANAGHGMARTYEETPAGRIAPAFFFRQEDYGLVSRRQGDFRARGANTLAFAAAGRQ